jgi:hypothetical protein
MTTAEPGKATTTTATIIGLVLFLSCAPAFARDANVLNAWECDNGIAVELRREAVHTFEIRLEFATPYPAEKKPLSEYPMYFKDNGAPVGNFNLKFTGRGAMLNGKPCRLSCTGGRECE